MSDEAAKIAVPRTSPAASLGAIRRRLGFWLVSLGAIVSDAGILCRPGLWVLRRAADKPALRTAQGTRLPAWSSDGAPLPCYGCAHVLRREAWPERPGRDPFHCGRCRRNPDGEHGVERDEYISTDVFRRMMGFGKTSLLDPSE